MVEPQTTPPWSPDQQKAYDTGWYLREMGHTEMLDTYKYDPVLRLAFEAGWNAAAEWEKEKEAAWTPNS